jgi:hypothetical protein
VCRDLGGGLPNSVDFPHGFYECHCIVQRLVIGYGASEPRRALFRVTLKPVFSPGMISYGIPTLWHDWGPVTIVDLSEEAAVLRG